MLSITTPNASSWLHRIYGRRWRGLEPPRHLQVFTEPGLRSILAAAGFSRTEVFTTARNASLMSSASESSYGTSSWLRRMAMIVKGELLQALESARIRWSPFCGEELVALASSGPLPYGDRNRRVEPCA